MYYLQHSTIVRTVSSDDSYNHLSLSVLILSKVDCALLSSFCGSPPELKILSPQFPLALVPISLDAPLSNEVHH